MKLLFNCSTNLQGGAAQNAANFIISSVKSNTQNSVDIKYHFIISEPVKKILDSQKCHIKNYSLIQKSPSKSLVSRSKIKSIERAFCPDLVYTMAGPAYVTFNSRHIMGCSNPYIIFADYSDINFGRNVFKSIVRYLRTLYQSWYIKKAEYFIFQTNSSRESFLEKFNINKNKSFVVNNAMGFLKDEYRKEISQERSSEIIILCPFEDYPHKGFHIIPKLCISLNKYIQNFKFLVTIDENKRNKNMIAKYKSSKFIKLIGKQPYKKMRELYKKSDIVFMPSILEIFSSVCIESLYFRLPLVVSSRDFNRDILKDHAFYCDPNSIQSCCESIKQAVTKKSDHEYLDISKQYIKRKYGVYSKRHQSIQNILLSLRND